MSGGKLARAARGMSLIELMIAVAIVGILAAIAYPSYQAQVRRGNRTEAKAELMRAANALEKCYTRYGRYEPPAGVCPTYNAILAGQPSETGRYQISFFQGVARNTYTLQAVPNVVDPECGTLRLNQAGQRTQTGPGPVARCW